MEKNEISINIGKVINDTLPDALEKALDRAGYLVENGAKERCGVASGTLRKSITHDVEDGVCYIGSNVEYAAYHHEKNPFLEESTQENLTEIMDCFKGVLE